MELLRTDAIIKVPREVAVCPICGADLTSIDIDEWEQDDEGLWCAVNPKANCDTEPDIDSADWHEWHRGHYSTPYIDWLPVEIKIEEWLKKNYRFDLDAPSPEAEIEKLKQWNENAKRF